MQALSGKIVLAQEGRFRLVTPNGQSKLFVLAVDAPQEPQDLNSLVGASVRIAYSRLPGRIAGLAHRIERA